ncbi:MAG TPA: VWA domain-containing protein [Nannocystis sp.]
MLGGCASAANLEDGGEHTTDEGTTGSPAYGSHTEGDSGGSGSGDESTSAASSGGTGGTEQGMDPGTTGEVPPDPGEPEPIDQFEPQAVDTDATCTSDAAVTWRVSVRRSDAMSSPAHAREALLGQWPSLHGVAIRPWEFLNYYTFAYPLAPPGQLRASAQLRAAKDDLGELYDLQVAVSGPQLDEGQRPPVHLTLALDNSGSMEGKAVELLKAAGHALASRLRAGDTVAVVTWNAATPVLLPVTTVSGPNDPKLLAAIDAFTPGGSASLSQALMSGFAQADEAYVASDINRLVILSDGGATASAEDLELLETRSSDLPGAPGVHTIAIGVGDPALYRHDLLDAIAEAGGGPSLYVGSAGEAEAQLGKRFISVMTQAATDVEVRLLLPPGLWLEVDVPMNIEVSEHDRVTLAAGDRAVVHRRLRPCVAEVDPTGLLGVELRWVDPLSGEVWESTTEWKLELLLAGETAWLAKGEAVLAYAAALEAVQRDPGDTSALEEATLRLSAAKSLLPSDGELAEIGEVLAALQEP